MRTICTCGVILLLFLASSSSTRGQASLTREMDNGVTLEGAIITNTDATSYGGAMTVTLARTVDLGLALGATSSGSSSGSTYGGEIKLYPVGHMGHRAVAGFSLFSGLQRATATRKLDWTWSEISVDVDVAYFGTEVFLTPQTSPKAYLQPLVRIAGLFNTDRDWEYVTTTVEGMLSLFAKTSETSALRFTLGFGATTDGDPLSAIFSVGLLNWGM
jgi:hypothetical protein